MQSKTFSWIETATSTAIGFKIALLAQLILFPLYGITVPGTTHLSLVVWFTVISLIRGYLVRRLFVWVHHWRVTHGYE